MGHGAYQDYIHEVGASEMIVTDNSRTQTGKKWEKTSCEVMTKQRRFTPHNQNRSKIEHRIQDVKHKVTLVMQQVKAPLVFWCYALIFVMDYLNYIAKKLLKFRTSMEVLNGETANISPFRFKFWQPVKFIDKAGFPESCLTMVRFIGITWETGDLFTFKVWSEPDGDWKKGREFVWNVVRARDQSEIEPEPVEVPDLGQFCFQHKYRTQKQKCNKEYAYELYDIPDGAVDDESVTEDITKIADGDEVVGNHGTALSDGVNLDAAETDTNQGGEEDRSSNRTTTPKPTQ